MGNRIKELRRIHHLTQDQLGELCGAGKSAVSQTERKPAQRFFSSDGLAPLDFNC